MNIENTLPEKLNNSSFMVLWKKSIISCVSILYHMILFNWKNKIKIQNKSEKLPNFGIKESKLGIAYTKSLEVKIKFNRKFHSKSERLLLNSTALLRIFSDF